MNVRTGSRLAWVLRHDLTVSLVLFLTFSGRLVAQPPADPSLGGHNTPWLGAIGFLFFSCALLWPAMNAVGNYFYEKTHEAFWEIFWRDRFPVVAVVVWIVFWICVSLFI
jgi:hypothetical protein